MDKYHLDSNFAAPNWNTFVNKYSLSDVQSHQFQRYLELLIIWNDKFNLTAITDKEKIIQYHFDDSLTLSKHLDFFSLQTIVDVGTGAGFPGLALKILFPHMRVILIEVNNKKRSFLNHIIKELALEDVTIYPYDWRTFLRTIHYNDIHETKIDYFFARASLQPTELMRAFKPSCIYHNTPIIYWASQQWQPEKNEAPFVEKEIVYTLDTVQRKFVFFKNIQHY